MAQNLSPEYAETAVRSSYLKLIDMTSGFYASDKTHVTVEARERFERRLHDLSLTCLLILITHVCAHKMFKIFSQITLPAWIPHLALCKRIFVHIEVSFSHFWHSKCRPASTNIAWSSKYNFLQVLRLHLRWRVRMVNGIWLHLPKEERNGSDQIRSDQIFQLENFPSLVSHVKEPEGKDYIRLETCNVHPRELKVLVGLGLHTISCLRACKKLECWMLKVACRIQNVEGLRSYRGCWNYFLRRKIRLAMSGWHILSLSW